MSAELVDPSQPSNNEALYEFSIYPFSTDPVFQEGLQSIVSSAHGKSAEELEYVIGQAKAFYFARATGHKIIWEHYVEWKKSHTSPFPGAPIDPPAEDPSAEDPASMVANARIGETEASRPLSFQQITELIKSGQTHLIPNNKVIPEALHVRPSPRLCFFSGP